jgi:hypothetical protein
VAVWAERVAFKVGVVQAWPESEKMRRMAHDRIADLVQDPRLVTEFVEAVVTSAAKRRLELQRDPFQLRLCKPAPMRTKKRS